MKRLMILSLAMMAFFTSCDEENANGTLVLSIDGLADLGTGLVYEGWVVVNGSPVSTGVFSVDASGELSKTQFSVDMTQLEEASMFVLSVEPTVDPDPAPSDLKVLSGVFNGNNASLSLSIIADFSAASGKYILATPTTTSTDDELSGLWFLDNSTGSPMASLNLPDLSGVSGWTYEGWAVFPGATGPISTGTFDTPNGADATGGGAYKGSDAAAPPFPGDDFVTGTSNGISFPSDLSGGTVVVSVEPVPDNSPDPFLVKPLVGSVPSNALDHTVYTVDANLITGTATR